MKLYLIGLSALLGTLFFGGAAMAQCVGGGDLAAGPQPGGCTVIAVQGKSVSPQAPSNGQVLVWNSTAGAWVPGTNGGGGGVSWPATNSIVISNGTSSPGGLAAVNGDCVLGAGGVWTAGSCGGGGGGSGTVTSIVFSAPLTGGTITTSGTAGIALASTDWFVGSGGNVPTATAPSAALDAALGSVQGDIAYRGAATWTVLGPGTTGQFLQTQGASANPQWATATGSGTVGSCSTADAIAYYASTGTTTACLAGVGTSGQVLTSNGAGVAPTFQTGGGGGLSGMTTGQLPVAASASTVTSSTPFGLTGNSTIIETTSGGLLTPSILPLATNAAIGGAEGDGLTISITAGVASTIGNVVLNTTGPTISANQWTQGTEFFTSTGSITYTLLASTAYNGSATISVNPQGTTTTLAPNGTDTINGVNASLTIPDGSHAVVAKTAAGAFKVTGLKATAGSGSVNVVTDGSTTVTNPAQIIFSGAAVSNTGGDATVTVTGGSGPTCPTGFTWSQTSGAGSGFGSGECAWTKTANNTATSISFTGLVGNNYDLTCSGVTGAAGFSSGIRFGESNTPITTNYGWSESQTDSNMTGTVVPFATGSNGTAATSVLLGTGDEQTIHAHFSGLATTGSHHLITADWASNLSGRYFNAFTGGAYAGDTNAIDEILIADVQGTPANIASGSCTLIAKAG